MPARRSSAASTLVLCPTPLELRHLEGSGSITLCGFGPVVPAARTAALIAEHRPDRVVLIGIAGTYDASRLAPGSALEFGGVMIDGVGVGEGDAFIAPAALGFPQWHDSVPPIIDSLTLAAGGDAHDRVLLTVCAASADDAQARRRRARFPSAVAEDMEGFAVAVACALAGVPLRIVRGISNVAGNRDTRSWCIAPALHAARARLESLLQSDTGWSTPA